MSIVICVVIEQFTVSKKQYSYLFTFLLFILKTTNKTKYEKIIKQSYYINKENLSKFYICLLEP